LEKIKKVPLDTCFPGYQGGDDPDVAKEFIKERFEERTRNSLYTHFTTAINTKNIDFVIRSVMKTILNNTLDNIGLVNKKN